MHRSDLIQGGPVEPPFCPFIGGCLGQQVNSKIVSGGGGQMVDIQFSFVPIPCLERKCMMWDLDTEPEQCGFLSMMDELFADDEDGDGDTLQD